VVTPALLEVTAHSLAAILGVWLGLTVLARSGSPSGRAFALVALAIALWSTSVIVQRLTTSADASIIARTIEELSAVIVIGATAHFSLSVASEGRPSARRLRILALAYTANLAFAAPTIVDSAISAPHLVTGTLLEAIFAWAWVAVRLGTLVLAGGWLVEAYRNAERGGLRRRQVGAALATVVTGGLGGALRFLPGLGDLDAWIGVSLVALAVVLAAYAVFAAGIFFDQAVAGRAFRTSLLGGLALFALALVVLAVEMASTTVTGTEAPIFTIIVLVVGATAYEPVSGWLRRRLGHRAAASMARDRLIRALGQSTLAGQPAEAGVGPALARLGRALDVVGVAVVRRDGSLVAAEGEREFPNVVPPIQLVSDGELVGELRVGPRSTGGPLDPHDEELLRQSAAYVTAALRTARRENEQIASLAGLAQERTDVETQATTLHAALIDHAATPTGLRVLALGPLRVERGGEPIRRWGGDKAGSRQAQGLFAFLLDRGERGVAKDEALELIWPDADLDRADLAFHRTMVGLRGTLDPGRGGKANQAIRFSNDRYRLDPRVVTWSDVEVFLALLDATRTATGSARLALLQQARLLYRGDYLDDCPFYGDSSHVEEQRDRLEARFVDALVALGEGHEAAGDRMAALDAYREAVRWAGDGCPPAGAGILRLAGAGDS
jgi:DNA-binding SARP family transcriptional activator